jgi:hypothetical protein
MSEEEIIEIERAPLEIVSGDSMEDLKFKCTNCESGVMSTKFYGGHGGTAKCKSCGHLRTIHDPERKAIELALYPMYCVQCHEHLVECDTCGKGYTKKTTKVICRQGVHLCSNSCDIDEDEDEDDDDDDDEPRKKHGKIAKAVTKEDLAAIAKAQQEQADKEQAALRAISVDTCAGPWGPYCMGMNSFSHKNVHHQDGTTGVVHLVLRQVKGDKNECIQKSAGIVVVEDKYATPICLRNCPWCGGNIKDDGNGPEKKGWN